LEVSWDEQKGLQLYVNKELVASTADYAVHPQPTRIDDYTIYLGRPNDDRTDGSYADAKIDELEFWYANRDLLQSDDGKFVMISRMSVTCDESNSEGFNHSLKVEKLVDARI